MPPSCKSSICSSRGFFSSLADKHAMADRNQQSPSSPVPRQGVTRFIKTIQNIFPCSNWTSNGNSFTNISWHPWAWLGHQRLQTSLHQVFHTHHDPLLSLHCTSTHFELHLLAFGPSCQIPSAPWWMSPGEQPSLNNSTWPARRQGHNNGASGNDVSQHTSPYASRSFWILSEALKQPDCRRGSMLEICETSKILFLLPFLKEKTSRSQQPRILYCGSWALDP